MTWRLICDGCARKLREAICSIGILKNPDLRCASCGVYIRKSADDVKGSGDKWFPISEDQLARTRALGELEPDGELHYSFALGEDEEDLGKAQDEICRPEAWGLSGPMVNKIVRCKVFKCDEVDLGMHVVQIYMNDHTPCPIFAGTVWRHDRWPSDFDVALALRLWRGPGAPEFIVEWYVESSIVKLKVRECRHGRGVFAVEDIPAGRDVLEIKGPLLSGQQALDAGDDVLQIGLNAFVGASGDVDDYLNHSCEPNCAVRIEDNNRATLFTLSAVSSGTELCFDYSTTSTDDHETWRMDCTCGSASCRKVISGCQYLDSQLVANYRSRNMLPDYVYKRAV